MLIVPLSPSLYCIIDNDFRPEPFSLNEETIVSTYDRFNIPSLDVDVIWRLSDFFDNDFRDRPAHVISNRNLRLVFVNPSANSFHNT